MRAIKGWFEAVMTKGQRAVPRSKCSKRGSSRCRGVVPGQTKPRHRCGRWTSPTTITIQVPLPRVRSQEPADGGSAWEGIRRGVGPPASGKTERQGTTGGRGAGGRREQREGFRSIGDYDFTSWSLGQKYSYAGGSTVRL